MITALRLFTLTLIAFAVSFAQTTVVGGGGGGSSSLTGLDDVGCTSVSFSATPTFDASGGNCFVLGALTANVTSITLSNEAAGQTLYFVFTQDGTGGRTVALPTEVDGSCPVASAANAVTIMTLAVQSTSVTQLTSCAAPLEADAITMNDEDPTNVDTPAANSYALFFDETNGGALSVKNNAGATTAVGGRSLFRVVWGINQAGGGWSSLTNTTGCSWDSTITTGSGTQFTSHGAPVMNATANEGFQCRGWIIPPGVDLTALTFSVVASEFVSNTNTWDIELYVQCFADGDAYGSFSTEHGAITLTAATGTTGRFLIGTDTTVDLSGACNTGEMLAPRIQVGSGGTSTDDIVILSAEIFEQ